MNTGKLKDVIKEIEEGRALLHDAIDKLEADNQRLRAALEEIANHDFNGLGCGMGCMEEMVHTAKAALSEEK